MQDKAAPLVNGKEKVSVTSLMAAMGKQVVNALGKQCLLVVDAYFAVAPVFTILKQTQDSNGQRLCHIVTRAKSNVVAYEDPPAKTGRRGRPRKYGAKRNLMALFETRCDNFEQVAIQLYGQYKSIYLCSLNLIWKPLQEKVRFVLVQDGMDQFILMCSDLTLSPTDIVMAYSYRFKIEVSFKVLKHLMGAFFYRFWTSVWPSIGKQTASDLTGVVDNPDNKRLIGQTVNAIEAFANFGCIATGILQMIALNCHQSIWSQYLGWLRTTTSTVPSEQVVKSVIQEEYYHNFHSFKNDAIFSIILSKSRRSAADLMAPAGEQV